MPFIAVFVFNVLTAFAYSFMAIMRSVAVGKLLTHPRYHTHGTICTVSSEWYNWTGGSNNEGQNDRDSNDKGPKDRV